PLNKWTHLAVSWSPYGTKLYVNGEVDASTSANVWPAFSGTVFAYLNYWGGSDFGLVDELHISKVARTDEEIRLRAVVSISGKATIIVSTYQDNAVVKLDSNGNILWATNVGANVLQAVENPTDKTIYAVGGGIFTKLSSDGAILLQKSISGSTIDVDPSNGTFYVGTYYEWASISKYDANGNFIKFFRGSIGGPAPAVYRADGSVYVNSYSAGVYKFDKNGNLLWQKQPVGWHNSYGFATIVVDQRDGSVVATAQDEGVTVRFDAAGNTIWTKQIHLPLQDISYSRNAIDTTENVVYGAGASSGNLYKINLTNGDVIWSKNIGGVGGSSATPSLDPFDGSIYVGNIYNKEMVKVDKNGNILWGPKYIGYYMWYLETTSDTGIISEKEVPETLPIRDIEGVGDAYAERLEKQEVKIIKDMASANVFSLYKKTGIPLFKLYVIKRRATLALDVKIERALFGSILQMPLGEIISMPDEELSRKANQPIEVISGLKRDISTLLISLDNSTVKAMTLERLT
ncbi:MAG: PQQ-binding-like beta-propeller repeat protein, partial [Candidatus Methanoperedens sp.]